MKEKGITKEEKQLRKQKEYERKIAIEKKRQEKLTNQLKSIS